MPQWKPDQGQAIERLYAWIATESDGGEGIVGAMLPGIPGFTPLIGADMGRIESYRPYAESLKTTTTCSVALVEFSLRTVLEVL